MKSLATPRVHSSLPPAPHKAASPGFSLLDESRLIKSASRQAGIISLGTTFRDRRNTSLSRSLWNTFAKPPPDSLGVQLGASDKGLHTADGDFDVNMGVECNRGSSMLLRETGIKSVGRCRDACAAQVDCVAAELDQILGKCMLWRECLYREPAMRVLRGMGQGGGNADVWGKRRATSGVRVMHRVGREWPVPASQVVWRANATIVVASYTYRLDWLRTIPNAFDVALYHKHDFVASPSGRARTMSDERLPLHFMRDRPQLCRSFSSGGRPRVGLPLEPCPPDKCNCSTGRNDDHRLAYYRVLPNYGRTDGKVGINGQNPIPPGGSREAYPYLQFILDFWDNLPNVLIFTQEPVPPTCLPACLPSACLPASCMLACLSAHRTTACIAAACGWSLRLEALTCCRLVVHGHRERQQVPARLRLPRCLRLGRTGDSTGGSRSRQRGSTACAATWSSTTTARATIGTGGCPRCSALTPNPTPTPHLET